MAQPHFNQQPNRLPALIRQNIGKSFIHFKNFSRQPSVRIAFLCLLAYVLIQKDFSFSVSFGKNTNIAEQMTTSVVSVPQATTVSYEKKPIYLEPQKSKPYIPKTVKKIEKITSKQSKTINKSPNHWWEKARAHSQNVNQSNYKKTTVSDIENLNLANPATAVSNALSPEQKKKAASYSNLGFILNPDFAENHNVDADIVQAKNQIAFNYVAKFSSIAQQEATQYNIPASITIAQGLLESNAGESNLAKKDHNHFGIKCRSQCVGCRCANYTDDSRFDMFRIFESDAHSFREHSLLLTGARYKHLLELPRSDYKNWAYGLKAAGYATDAKYAFKLIAIIEALQLYKLDN